MRSKPDGLLVSLRGSLVRFSGWEASPVTPGRRLAGKAAARGSGLPGYRQGSS
jgi:hypothetical protein